MASSSDVTTTPGFELVTWILKRSSTPLTNPEVVSVAFTSANKVEVISPKSQVQVNNVLKTAINKVTKVEVKDKLPDLVKETENVDNEEKPEGNKIEELDKNEEEENKKEEEDPEKKEEDKEKKEEENKDKKEEVKEEEVVKEVVHKVQQGQVGKDDPECPSTFEIDNNLLNSDAGGGRVIASRIVLEATHLLFCRQWKFVASVRLPFGSAEVRDVLLFCRDSRILPGLGGHDSFAMIELQKPNLLRMYNVAEKVEADVKAAVAEHWPAGLTSKESEVINGGVKEYRLNETPWMKSEIEVTSGTEDGVAVTAKKTTLMTSQQNLVSRILLAMNKSELNMYARVTHESDMADQRTMLIFRQSNVTYSESLTLKLAG